MIWVVEMRSGATAPAPLPGLGYAIFLSPAFPTASHPGRAALGAVRLRGIALALPVPVYALGGIDEGTAARLAGAPLAGLAAIGALAAE